MVQLSSDGSIDPEGTELQYQWVEIIDGNEFAFSNEAHPLVGFSEGTHQIRLCVFDEYLAQACDEIMVVILPYTADFIRGDSNRDGKVDISDAINTLGHLFMGTGEVICEDAADANDDGKIDISDAIATLTFLFIGGEKIPPPYPSMGKDTTQDILGCKS